MMQLPHRLIWGRLSRHKSKFGVQRCLHETTVTQPPTTVPTPPPVPPSHGKASKEVKEIKIPVPWGHISGKWWGRADVQPVLMLHGWQDNAGTFDTLAPLLHNESLLALDAVGHGLSSHYPLGQCYTFVDGVVALRLAVRHFGWDGGRVSLIGHSMGSATAYAYAAAYPEGVDRLVSLDDIRGALVSTLAPAAGEMRRVVDSELSYEGRLGDASLLPSHGYDDIVDLYWRGCKGAVTRESAEVILRRGLATSGAGGYRFARDPRVKVFSWGGVSQAGFLAAASRIACEVLSIRAAGSFTSDARALSLHEECLAAVGHSARRLESRVVEGTHHTHLNTPQLVAPLVNRFFEARDEELVY